MGIKNLHPFLRKHCPDIYRKVPLSKFQNQTLAVDVSIYLFKYKIIFGPRWLDAFLHFITCLLEHGIHLVFVYDTKAPPEKEIERKVRSEARIRLRQKLESIKRSWDNMKKDLTGADDEFAVSFGIEDPVFLQFISRQISPTFTLSKKTMEEEIQKIENSLSYISNKEFSLTKILCDACGIPYIDSEWEAEAACSRLSSLGVVQGVITDDTDVFAYGATNMIYKINFEDLSCIEIHSEDILHGLGMTKEEFLDFCILLGTDYNNTIPRVGCEKSFRLIKEYKSIEGLAQQRPDLPIHVLNHQRIQEIFHYPIIVPTELDMTKKPDPIRLSEFCFVHNLQFDYHRLLYIKTDLSTQDEENKHVCVLRELQQGRGTTRSGEGVV